eukprot:gnl/TRDRNA2_/TRDRNA2_186766_c0_seq1.p1 gnl/TRDRNA2_/TRDRNA2_186766_c0~~gnl/TRDRNA2_/TRDRNA2_186766_c0_seq1.p1  ORF type:complete len:169 (-),score=25.85 gnl/TRDRNA2_/TRDRNA2_186766_c0_seq1:73-579(-)
MKWLTSLAAVALVGGAAAATNELIAGSLVGWGSQVDDAPSVPVAPEPHATQSVPQPAHAVHRAEASLLQGPGTASSGRIVNPPGWATCCDFVRDRIAQGSVGDTLVQEMGATCEPAVESGVAMPAYRDACEKVQRFTADVAADPQSIDVEVFCRNLMTMFQAAGPKTR